MESVWVVILLTDGAANASEPIGLTLNRFCPPSTWGAQPFCRDTDNDTRHSLLNTAKQNPDNVFDPDHYDADDYARDRADFVGCAPEVVDAAPWCRDSLNYAAVPPEGGQGAVIYSIGLGRLVADNGIGGPRDAGDALLRYIAAVGDDGNPASDPCAAVAPPPAGLTAGNDSYQCGNYYFSEFGTGLASVFESIASRIFTRLTR
jgi:hypothetical protein